MHVNKEVGFGWEGDLYLSHPHVPVTSSRTWHTYAHLSLTYPHLALSCLSQVPAGSLHPALLREDRLAIIKLHLREVPPPP